MYLNAVYVKFSNSSLQENVKNVVKTFHETWLKCYCVGFKNISQAFCRKMHCTNNKKRVFSVECFKIIIGALHIVL